VSTLAFVDDVDGIVPVVDRERLDGLVLGPDGGWSGLSRGEASLAARLLQGWCASELGLERAEWRTVAKPAGRSPRGSASYAAEPVTEVLATLPGGDRPDVEARGLDDYDSTRVPVMSCSCGGGIGCAALEVEVTFARDRVHWRINDHRLEFSNGPYFAAVRELLALAGESPVLITEGEWSSPTPTKVVSAAEARRVSVRW
jgi:hypothetical protein